MNLLLSDNIRSIESPTVILQQIMRITKVVIPPMTLGAGGGGGGGGGQ